MNKCKLVEECKLLKLRPRQILTVVRTFNRLKFSRKLLIVAGTGYGKTYVFVSTIHLLVKFGIVTGKILIVTNRVILIDQITENFKKILDVDLKQITSKDSEYARYNITTVQTYTSLKEKGATVPRIGLLILDEAHFTCSQTYIDLIQDIRSVTPNAITLGYTATPIRGDDVSLMTIFDYIADEIQLGELVDKQLLTRCSLHTHFINDGYYFYYKAYEQFKKLRELANRPLKTIFFCSSIKECHKLYDILKTEEKVGIVNYHSKSEQTLSDFKSGKIDIILNVRILVEGFDCPDVNCIVLCSTVSHLGTLIQMVGRAARLAKDKDIYYCLDLKDNFNTLKPEDVNFLEHVDTTELRFDPSMLFFKDKSAKVLGFLKDLEIYHNDNECPHCGLTLSNKHYCYDCFAEFIGINKVTIKPVFNDTGDIVALKQPGTASKSMDLKNIMRGNVINIMKPCKLLPLSKDQSKKLAIYALNGGENKRGFGTYLYLYSERIQNYIIILFKVDSNSRLYIIVANFTAPDYDKNTLNNLVGMLGLIFLPLHENTLTADRGHHMTRKIETELSEFDLTTDWVKRAVLNYSPFLLKVTRFLKRLIVR